MHRLKTVAPTILALLAIAGCAQVNGLVKGPDTSRTFPSDLKNLMANTVPEKNGRVTYPRLGVALTDTKEARSLVDGTLDCGHFKITEWQSEKAKDEREFDICVVRDERQIGTFQNSAYMLDPHNQWAITAKYGGNPSRDYQPIGTHWSAGPRVAQFFVPPAWIDSDRTPSQTSLIEGLLSFVGVYGVNVDPRIWFYQIDQSN